MWIFLRALPPNGANIHKRSSLAVICNESMYRIHKKGLDIDSVTFEQVKNECPTYYECLIDAISMGITLFKYPYLES